MSKRYCVTIKHSWFRDPRVIVEVVSEYPSDTPGTLAGQKFRYPAVVYDIPEIDRLLNGGKAE